MAFQVVKFVADCAGQEFLSLQFPLVHIQIVITDDNTVGSCHFTDFSGDRQAALVTGLLSVLLDDLGIDHRQRLVLFLRDINDNQPLEDSHLWCSQTDTAGLIHCLEHIFRKCTDAGCHFFDNFCFFSENGITHLSDRTQRHNIPFYSSVKMSRVPYPHRSRSEGIDRIKVKLYLHVAETGSGIPAFPGLRLFYHIFTTNQCIIFFRFYV